LPWPGQPSPPRHPPRPPPSRGRRATSGSASTSRRRGYGFIIGDERLSYAPEVLIEAYYRFQLTREVSLGVNYQPLFNPAYHRDRGPVQVFTGRIHVAF
jgi:hypothetical protein